MCLRMCMQDILVDIRGCSRSDSKVALSLEGKIDRFAASIFVFLVEEGVWCVFMNQIGGRGAWFDLERRRRDAGKSTFRGRSWARHMAKPAFSASQTMYVGLAKIGLPLYEVHTRTHINCFHRFSCSLVSALGAAAHLRQGRIDPVDSRFVFFTCHVKCTILSRLSTPQ